MLNHRDALALAISRLEDILKGDDGQAYKEAQKALPDLLKALAAPQSVYVLEYNDCLHESSYEVQGAFHREVDAKNDIEPFKRRKFKGGRVYNWQDVRVRKITVK